MYTFPWKGISSGFKWTLTVFLVCLPTVPFIIALYLSIISFNFPLQPWNMVEIFLSNLLRSGFSFLVSGICYGEWDSPGCHIALWHWQQFIMVFFHYPKSTLVNFNSFHMKYMAPLKITIPITLCKYVPRIILYLVP